MDKAVYTSMEKTNRHKIMHFSIIILCRYLIDSSNANSTKYKMTCIHDY